MTETSITNTATVQVTVVYSNDIHAETKKPVVYLEIKNYNFIVYFNCIATFQN